MSSAYVLWKDTPSIYRKCLYKWGPTSISVVHYARVGLESLLYVWSLSIVYRQ